jgi:hypothetical protein
MWLLRSPTSAAALTRRTCRIRSVALLYLATTSMSAVILPPMIESRWGHRMVAYDGRLFVVGGRAPSGRVLIYTPGKDWTLGAAMPRVRDHLSVVEVGGKLWAIGAPLHRSVAIAINRVDGLLARAAGTVGGNGCGWPCGSRAIRLGHLSSRLLLCGIGFPQWGQGSRRESPRML